jgi:orotate phosphoribosyltransferase
MAWRKRSRVVESIATALVKTDAIQFGTFMMPNDKRSSYYINLRGLPSFPGAYRAVTDAFLAFVKDKVGLKSFDAIAGIPVSGVTFSSPLALATAKPMIYVRSGIGLDRTQRMVEGSIRPGWKILLVDDLVTSGGTLSSSVAAIRQEGGEVKDAVALIDRMEGARERLLKEGVKLHSITDILEVSDFLLSKNLISEENLKSITKQVGRGLSRP